MSTKSKHSPPKTTKGRPAEAQTERTADDNVRAEDHGDAAQQRVVKDNQRPANQMDRRTDHGGDEEESGEPRSLWAHFKEDPLPWILSVSTAGILISSIALTVATGFVYKATDRLADTTVGLKTATESLAKYAEEQGRDMRESLGIAWDSVKTAENLVKAVEKAGAVAQGNLDVAKEALEIQRVAGREGLKQQRPHIAIVDVEIQNFDSSTAFWENSIPVEARIHIRNIGPTRANQVKGWAHVSAASPRTTSFRPGGPSIIFPSDSVGNSLDSLGIASEKPNFPLGSKEKILNGASAIFVYGEITYTDVIDSTRYSTKFRYSYSGNPIPSDHILRPIKTKDGNEEK